MQESIFVNSTIDEAMKLFVDNKDKEYSLEYNNFLCSVIRMLIVIYGEEIINCYLTKDEEKFYNSLLKYGLTVDNMSDFIFTFEKFNKFDKKQQKKSIKKKNKYFNLVQKYLIDMMVLRKNNEAVDIEVLSEFNNLLFVESSKDFYRKSVALLLAYNPYEIEEYAKKENILVG